MFHICFAADENYIKYTAVLITSIIKSTDTSRKFKDFFAQNSAAQSVAGGGGDFENSKQPSKPLNNGLSAYKKLDYSTLSNDEKSEGYIFHILTDKISESTRQKLKNLAKTLSKIYPCEIRIHLCDDAIFKGLPKLGGNYLAYFRLFVANFIPQSAKICLYLDVDMLVMQDLRGLFALDLSGKLAGVVKDWVRSNPKRLRAKALLDRDFRFDSFYFNSGFLLINLQEWRKQGIQNQIFSVLSRYNVKQHDQDALNAVIRQPQALVLPFEFNFLITAFSNAICRDDRVNFHYDYTRKELNFATLHPIIVHFVFVHKAWRYPYNYADTKNKALGEYWWEIALQTPHFADELGKIFKQIQAERSANMDFESCVAVLMMKCSQNFLGYFKIPFVIAKAFKARERGEFKRAQISSNAQKFTPSEHNLAYEFFHIATKAWHRRRKGKLISLPWQAYRTKLRCEKYGIARAMSENL